ncbi:hypothetical protein [Dyella agri]|uniref:Uncharacterized protein n=1 Tax=Dyella agri TaxID=1926869 RepID=A0ABW8KBI7_9GAMM
MTDTIELLEAISGDASLRYASSDELKGALNRSQTNAELTLAMASGDSVLLRQMLSCNGIVQQVEQAPQIQSVALLELDWARSAA